MMILHVTRNPFGGNIIRYIQQNSQRPPLLKIISLIVIATIIIAAILQWLLLVFFLLGLFVIIGTARIIITNIRKNN